MLEQIGTSATPGNPARVKPPFGAADDVRWMFLTGAHKSGTTWIEHMIVTHPEIFITGEAWFLGADWDLDDWLNADRFREWANLSTVQDSWMQGVGIDDQEAAARRAMIESQMRLRLEPGVKVMGDRSPLRYLQKIEQLHRLFPDAVVVNALRDGRDVAVSHHFHMIRNGEQWAFQNKKELKIRQKYFVENKGDPVPLFSKSSLQKVARLWLDAIDGRSRGIDLFKDRFIDLRYEELLADPYGVVRVFQMLGVSTVKETIEHCIESNRFERKTGRKPGEADSKSFVRKGVAGDWKNHFRDEDRALFKEVAGEALIALGYAEDMDW